ncbi:MULTISPECIES: hypothetical protein [Clostridia]|uniref:hypothetical protein n=1 Tax=Clostridia TaxID=186801 RepID=UPI0018ABD27C|nr:hypothetical protein [Clostridium sp. 1001270J_160509_D11]
MINLIRADLFKMRKSNSIKILFLLCCISAFIMYEVCKELSKGNLGSDIVGFGSFVTDFQMISLVSVIFISIFICNDFDNKTIQDSISTGHSRASILICKTISYYISILIFLLPYMIITIVGVCSNNTFESFLPSVFQNIIKNESGVTFDSAVFLKIFLIYITMTIVYASQISISILLAFLFKRPVIVISLGYVLNASIAQIVNIDKLSDLFKLTPYGVDYSKLTLDASLSVYSNFISISLIFMAIILILSYISFKRAEIK